MYELFKLIDIFIGTNVRFNYNFSAHSVHYSLGKHDRNYGFARVKKQGTEFAFTDINLEYIFVIVVSSIENEIFRKKGAAIQKGLR